MSTLFSVGFKRKATATAEGVEQADAARKAREAEDAARLKAACAEKQAAVALLLAAWMASLASSERRSHQ